MSRHRTFPLRGLTPEERQFLVRLQRSATAPASQVARAKALLAEAAPLCYTAQEREQILAKVRDSHRIGFRTALRSGRLACCRRPYGERACRRSVGR
jgi:hypothetical protein